MQLKQIALAVAAATAAPAALALAPSAIDANTVRLWVSGASAPTASVFKGFMTLCEGMEYKDANGDVKTNPGSLNAHLYLESSAPGRLPGNAGDRMAYACKVSTNDGRAGSLEGKNVVLYHTVEGGSFNAYAPHIRILGEANPSLPGSLRRIRNVQDLATSGQCAAGIAETVSVDVSGVINNVKVYRGCSTTVVNFNPGQPKRATPTAEPDRPDGGYSDTEYLINKLNLGITTDLDQIGSEVSTNIGQVFGVAVSYPLYYQLQKNDVLSGLIAPSCIAFPHTASSPNLGLACQPNLPAHKYTAIAAADSIGGVDATTFGAAAPTPPGGKIQLHRRAITSGTQSASNLRFLNKPCARGEAGGALEPARSTDSTDYVTVTENSSTGGVRTGLTNASNAGQYGLGIVSMENVPTASDRWAFVKLSGVSPNSDAKQRANAMSGNYDFWYELVGFTADSDSAPALYEAKNLMDALNVSLGNPAITDLTGLFITPMAGVTGSNVGSGTRMGKSCQPIVQ